MAASVWIIPWIGRFVALVISRPRPLMIPVVSVWSKPKGLPIANTFWPTCRFVDVPSGIGGSRCLGASILRTAMSLSGSAPTSRAFHVD